MSPDIYILNSGFPGSLHFTYLILLTRALATDNFHCLCLLTLSCELHIFRLEHDVLILLMIYGRKEETN